MSLHVFYSYSHRDEQFREKLATSLAPLRQKKLITEWHDRKIAPGINWDVEISTQLESSDLVLALLSPDFLASDYCFGVEMELAFTRVKERRSMLVPILVRPCMWEESRFSALQMIPRDAKPIASAQFLDEALKEVSREIRDLVLDALSISKHEEPEKSSRTSSDSSLDIVRKQIHAYARLYEKTRQRMPASDTRTKQRFLKVCSLLLPRRIRYLQSCVAVHRQVNAWRQSQYSRRSRMKHH
ncbi:toll/interleukin-1 receptor domain-containing protein [Variovorax sp. J22P240]|uniref:toll/interleukin-1 receptor domain-containing protein n=1 Tax=Variovorax sp. J22P240 TaxID=3053514 RepID=UPI002575F18D|nr:toll/interleukin-1 receptor domain-containing protein [Variovorax sp. J22P240]MDM0002839.1 toll/interleukin-1 receptor domain-containing protein [Variovorax sp. J22P240]